MLRKIKRDMLKNGLSTKRKAQVGYLQAECIRGGSGQGLLCIRRHGHCFFLCVHVGIDGSYTPIFRSTAAPKLNTVTSATRITADAQAMFTAWAFAPSCAR